MRSPHVRRPAHRIPLRYVWASLAIDLSPVPDAVQVDAVADNVVADTVRPHLQPPLADPLAFQLLDLREGGNTFSP